MFYRFMRGVVRVLLALVNGNAAMRIKSFTQDDCILVAPHRAWWDPLYLAVAAAQGIRLYGKRRTCCSKIQFCDLY